MTGKHPGQDAAAHGYAPRLVEVRPTPGQVAWQEMGFYGFLHFGMNTMTNREWGLGHENPALFDPQGVDVDQWMRALKSAGMTGAILTAKHHDGFCLWPSDQTAHTVAASPWHGGKGDLVRDVSDAARRHGLRFGLYLSPWDRTESSYGTGSGYDDFYVAQLTELLSGYGDVFSVWFDGANGEGPNGRRQRYDWDRYYEVIRRLQPGAVINVCGPDVRWCGNEAGHTRPNEWSVVPRALQDAERIAEKSQQIDDGHFASLIKSDEDDLGSRAALAGHDDLVWYPAEVNTSIRPGWFHHPEEDDQVRTTADLMSLYESSVGGNACLLLNVPPTREGLIATPDVDSLRELGRKIQDLRSRTIAPALILSAGVIVSEAGDPVAEDPGAGVEDSTTVLDGRGTWWAGSADDEEPAILIRLAKPTTIAGLILGEQITQGQRLEEVIVRGGQGETTSTLTVIGAVGYQHIARIDPVTVDTIVLHIQKTRGAPCLSRVQLIAAPA